MLTVSSSQPPSGTWLLTRALQKFELVIFFRSCWVYGSSCSKLCWYGLEGGGGLIWNQKTLQTVHSKFPLNVSLENTTDWGWGVPNLSKV